MSERDGQGDLDDAARDALARLTRVLRSPDPSADLGGHAPVSLLNPDAGSHAISERPEELRAAVRAGERTWREFPYYASRYGERGQRFSWSDSAWLAMLADLREEQVHHQVAWLGRLLAVRGMPRFLLENHLTVLHDELLREGGPDHARYDVLLRAAARLGEERRARIDDATHAALSAAFDRRVGAEWAQRLRRSGEILVAAVADEASGIDAAVSSLLPWFTSPARFPDAWISAVNTTIREARKAATGRP